MSRITREEVTRIASLARLSLDEEESLRTTAQLGAILDYVAQLSEVDTTGIEPTAHAIPLRTPLREDRAVAGMAPELAVANAPQREGTAFVVPLVIDGEES
jgi:aspartyl-tRNA(Asn)/glutamyl-tRNA(Gln) amidotransferase subunit C